MQYIYEDEVILFQTPSIGNSIFINNVKEEDKEMVKTHMEMYGLLYKVIEKEHYNQYWYYSKNAPLQCIERNQNILQIGYRRYRMNMSQPKDNPKKFKPRTLRITEMITLCNYYIGLKWCLLMKPVTLTFEGIVLDEQPKKWCYRCLS